jgi:hypothetical protein
MRAREEERNALRATIGWRFTNQKACVKPKKLYPMAHFP